VKEKEEKEDGEREGERELKRGETESERVITTLGFKW
jgi:hypothetical protein